MLRADLLFVFCVTTGGNPSMDIEGGMMYETEAAKVRPEPTRLRGPVRTVQPRGLGVGLFALAQRRPGLGHHAGIISAPVEAVARRRGDPQPAGLAPPGRPEPGRGSCQERL